MDKRETYIKMSDCEEIQGQRATKEGDVVYRRGDGWVGVYPSCWAIDSVWLPTQDKLQEMVRGKNDPHCGAMITRFTDWYNETQAHAASMEQLWLAFVMKEKFNKTWDGEKWCLSISR